ncbi:MAG: PAS domain S-box protein [Chloroflexota bacterium]
MQEKHLHLDQKDIRITLAEMIYPWIIFSLVIFAILTYWTVGLHITLVGSLASIGLFTLTHRLTKKRFFRTGTYTLFIYSLLVYSGISIIANRSALNPAFFTLIVFVPYFYVMLGRQSARFISVVLPIYITAHFFIEINDIILVETHPTPIELLRLLFSVGLLTTSFLFVFSLGIVTLEDEKAAIEGEYKRLFENLPIGIYRTSPEGIQIRSNPALWKMEGYESEEDSILDSFDIAAEWYVEPGRRDEFINAIKTEGRIVNFESEIYHRKTGEKIWISESAYPVHDDTGNILFYEGSVQDITSRKFAELKIIDRANELAQLSEEYKNVTNSARDVIIKLDDKGLITYANPAIKRVFGYKPVEVVGKQATLFLDEDHKEQYINKIQSYLKTEKFRNSNSVLKMSGQRKNGEKIISELTLSQWRDPAGQKVYTAIIRDVTEREKMSEFLNHMQRLDSLGVLAGGIAHDFNNLLVAILAQTSLAMHKIEEESGAYAHLKKAKTASLQAADLAKKLLAYSGKGHFEMQPLNLNQMIEENVDLHKVAIPKEINLVMRLDVSLPQIFGDRSQIQQIIMNLLINAADAIGDQVGEIRLVTELREIRKRDSILWTRSGTPLTPGTYAVLHISDTGSGMNKETLNRIFEPFYTTKHTGTGLGLAAVQGVVRGHQGSMLVESSLGKGTTFSIYFPVEEEQEASFVKPLSS